MNFLSKLVFKFKKKWISTQWNPKVSYNFTLFFIYIIVMELIVKIRNVKWS